MFCKNCGKELGTDAQFCPKCGEKIKSERTGFVRGKTIPIVLLGMVLIAGAILVFCLIENSNYISDEKIYELLYAQDSISLFVDNEVTNLKIHEISNLQQSSIEGTKQTHISCEAKLVNEDYEAETEISAIVEKQDGEWSLHSESITAIQDIKPLHGTTKEEVLPEELIKECYSQIAWDTYSYPVTWQVDDHITDCDKYSDRIIYSYSFVTNTAIIRGQVEYCYEFIGVDGWTLVQTNHMNSDIEWKLEGVWTFNNPGNTI